MKDTFRYYNNSSLEMTSLLLTCKKKKPFSLHSVGKLTTIFSAHPVPSLIGALRGHKEAIYSRAAAARMDS